MSRNLCAQHTATRGASCTRRLPLACAGAQLAELAQQLLTRSTPVGAGRSTSHSLRGGCVNAGGWCASPRAAGAAGSMGSRSVLSEETTLPPHFEALLQRRQPYEVRAALN